MICVWRSIRLSLLVGCPDWLHNLFLGDYLGPSIPLGIHRWIPLQGGYYSGEGSDCPCFGHIHLRLIPSQAPLTSESLSMTRVHLILHNRGHLYHFFTCHHKSFTLTSGVATKLEIAGHHVYAHLSPPISATCRRSNNRHWELHQALITPSVPTNRDTQKASKRKTLTYTHSNSNLSQNYLLERRLTYFGFGVYSQGPLWGVDNEP